MDEPILDPDSQPTWIESVAGDQTRKDQLLAWVKENWAKVKSQEKAREVSVSPTHSPS